MIRTLLRILGRSAFTVAIAVIVAFLLVELIPGDAAARIVGPQADPARLAEVRRQLGLDRSGIVRFGNFTVGLLRGDLGESVISRQPVRTLIVNRLGPTLSIIALGNVLGICFGSLLARIAARRPGRAVDQAVSSGLAVIVAVPGFLTAYLVVFVFAVQLRWFPVFGYVSPSESVAQWLHHLVMPAFTLSIGVSLLVARQLRGGLIDHLDGEVVRFARARGIPERVVFRRHAWRRAMATVIPLIAIDIAFQLSGTIVVEQVFNIEGLGRLAVASVRNRDLPVIQGLVVVCAVLVTLISPFAALLARRLDPSGGAS